MNVFPSPPLFRQFSWSFSKFFHTFPAFICHFECFSRFFHLEDFFRAGFWWNCWFFEFMRNFAIKLNNSLAKTDDLFNLLLQIDMFPVVLNHRQYFCPFSLLFCCRLSVCLLVSFSSNYITLFARLLLN